MVNLQVKTFRSQKLRDHAGGRSSGAPIKSDLVGGGPADLLLTPLSHTAAFNIAHTRTERSWTERTSWSSAQAARLFPPGGNAL